MKNNELVSLYQKAGYSFYELNNIFYLNKGIIGYSFPTIDSVDLNNFNIKEISKRYLFCLIKIDHAKKNCNEYIFTGNNYKLDDFHSKIRNQIRKGLKECIIRRPTLGELLQYGLEINNDTLKRHKQKIKILQNPSKWEKYISAFYNDSLVHVLGAFTEDKMIGYILAIKTEKKYYVLHPFFNKQFSSLCPMNALLFTLVNGILEKDGTISISYGVESFEPNMGLDKFKTSMLFKKERATRMLYINPLLKCVLVFLYVSFKHLRIMRRSNLNKKIIYTLNSNKLLYSK